MAKEQPWFVIGIADTTLYDFIEAMSYENALDTAASLAADLTSISRENARKELEEDGDFLGGGIRIFVRQPR